MKNYLKIAAAALAVGVASQAVADPVVYLTGSTAFRSTAFLALSASTPTNSPNNVFDSNTVSYVTYGNSAAKSANYQIFHGNIGGSGVYIDCRWSGSEAGIASACNATLLNVDRTGNTVNLAGSPCQWMDVNNFPGLTTPGTTILVTTNPPASLLETNSDGSAFTHVADLAQADTSQSVSWTPNTGGQTALVNYGIEGIVTFALCKNYNSTPTSAYNDLTNITLPQYNILLAKGRLPVSFITGNPADTNYAYCVGRNKGSGTRMVQLSTSTFGPHNGVIQYSIGYGVDSTDPSQSSTLILTKENNNGYESGGGVAQAIDVDGSLQQVDPYSGTNGWMAIGYAGPSDINPSSPSSTVPHPLGPSYWLTLDGIPVSNGTIENGQDWLWGAEHLYGKSGIAGTAAVVATNLYSAIVGQIAAQGYGTNTAILDPAIPLPLMTASRGSDTAFPVAGTMTRFKY